MGRSVDDDDPGFDELPTPNISDSDRIRHYRQFPPGVPAVRNGAARALELLKKELEPDGKEVAKHLRREQPDPYKLAVSIATELVGLREREESGEHERDKAMEPVLALPGKVAAVEAKQKQHDEEISKYKGSALKAALAVIVTVGSASVAIVKILQDKAQAEGRLLERQDTQQREIDRLRGQMDSVLRGRGYDYDIHPRLEPPKASP